VGTDTADFGGGPAVVVVLKSGATAGSASGQGTDTLLSIEKAKGTSGADRLTGSTAVNLLVGRGGNDTLNTRDSVKDAVNCGGGTKDVAVVDAKDAVATNCETVKRA
jgi:hypothetical protein